MMVEKEPLYPGKTFCGPTTVGLALEKYFDSFLLSKVQSEGSYSSVLSHT